MVGERLNDRYRIEAVVWSGTMSNVYRATDERHHRSVAIKALLHVFADNILYRSRYEREAEILQQVRHPHIVPYIDHFQDGANFYLVMEYMGGGNLYERLTSHGALSIPDANRVLIGISDALHALHQQRIIHRDLKPENILLNMQGKAFLCDFGEAYTLGRSSTTDPALSAVAGTPYYAAPETWNGQPQNAQSDVWALGIVMFEMLTGDVPFRGTTVDEVKQKIQNERLPDIQPLRPDLPQGLQQILSKALDKEKSRRYRNIHDFHQDLKRGQPAHLSIKTETLVTVLVVILLVVVVVSYLVLGDSAETGTTTPEPSAPITQQNDSIFGG